MYLILSVMWLIAAIMLFAWSFAEPGNPMNKIWGSDIPLGWVAVFMLAYNLVRWWTIKKYAAPRREPARPLPPRPVVKPDEEEGTVRK